MVIPNAMQVYNMIIMRTFFQSIPFELTEAARLDGANDFKILWDVILPLSKASIATIALFYAVMHWNSWFQASIYFSSSDKAPLQLVLRNMVINAETLVKSGEASNLGSTSINYATLFISMLPMMALYPFIQKYFVKGVMIESYLEEGSQKIGCTNHVFGKSITDPCLGWDDSEKLIYTIAEKC